MQLIAGRWRAAGAVYPAGVDIRDRAWVQRRVDEGATVTAIAAEASVSRQTAHTWLRRHGIDLEKRKPARPERDELARLYYEHGSAAGVARELGVATGTAWRWITAAGIDPQPPGRPDVPLDVERITRQRRDGASWAAIAAEHGVSVSTLQRRIRAASN